jgi:hypothetical protein
MNLRKVKKVYPILFGLIFLISLKSLAGAMASEGAPKSLRNFVVFNTSGVVKQVNLDATFTANLAGSFPGGISGGGNSDNRDLIIRSAGGGVRPQDYRALPAREGTDTNTEVTAINNPDTTNTQTSSDNKNTKLVVQDEANVNAKVESNAKTETKPYTTNTQTSSDNKSTTKVVTVSNGDTVISNITTTNNPDTTNTQNKSDNKNSTLVVQNVSGNTTIGTSTSTPTDVKQGTTVTVAITQSTIAQDIIKAHQTLVQTTEAIERKEAILQYVQLVIASLEKKDKLTDDEKKELEKLRTEETSQIAELTQSNIQEKTDQGKLTKLVNDQKALENAEKLKEDVAAQNTKITTLEQQIADKKVEIEQSKNKPLTDEDKKRLEAFAVKQRMSLAGEPYIDFTPKEKFTPLEAEYLEDYVSKYPLVNGKQLRKLGDLKIVSKSQETINKEKELTDLDQKLIEEKKALTDILAKKETAVVDNKEITNAKKTLEEEKKKLADLEKQAIEDTKNELSEDQKKEAEQKYKAACLANTNLENVSELEKKYLDTKLKDKDFVNKLREDLVAEKTKILEKEFAAQFEYRDQLIKELEEAKKNPGGFSSQTMRSMNLTRLESAISSVNSQFDFRKSIMSVYTNVTITANKPKSDSIIEISAESKAKIEEQKKVVKKSQELVDAIDQSEKDAKNRTYAVVPSRPKNIDDGTQVVTDLAKFNPNTTGIFGKPPGTGVTNTVKIDPVADRPKINFNFLSSKQ